MGGAFGVVVLAVREAPGASLLCAARIALATGAAEVVVVVGSEAVRRSLRGLPVRAVIARGGRGDSISTGVSVLGPRVGAVVVTLANRVRVTSEQLRALAGALGEGRAVVASSYEGIVGAPAAFARSEFPRLRALTGGDGARSLLEGAPTISFAGANVRVNHPDALSTPIFHIVFRRLSPLRSRTCRAPPCVG